MFFQIDNEVVDKKKDLRVLSLFSGCGGMDLGLEGNFIAHKKSINPKNKEYIQRKINNDWILLKSTRFRTVFANDILKEAKIAWAHYMKRFGYSSDIYHNESIVDLVKLHKSGINIFPEKIDVVTGGFPCQDFSVAGKRQGFKSNKNHLGHYIQNGSVVSEETRGKLYYWMKEVVDITKPKIFIAENVKGLVNLGDVKNIIQQDFSSADDDGYIVLEPQVLHAANYGVPESRERVIFIGIRKNALRVEALSALLSDPIPEEYNPYPSPTHACTLDDDSLSPPVVLRDIFRDLKEPEETLDLSQRNYSKAKYMGAHCQGQKEVSLDKIGPTIRSEHHGNIEYRRLSLEHGGCINEELEKGMEERRLTPRECALIQTFPPDYSFVIPMKNYANRRFLLSSSAAYKIIGNAVPPILAYNIGKRIEELWPLLFNLD
ncbi:DNA (cytosine-5-)-methyltransferase [Bacteroides pyogenes]|uniref:DNA cytosine methyltransferase n=1 Tax=Bacteroides pyogenes TaxID=310300 RepID=UPI002A821DEC|nr:DNA (cytosine-5-)-methyltransferase [Bacteroides pyogenes]MDY4250798.1 DNA (cytosine-5-)-methyltransferase [Bacteroides pyogenes]